jgi:hypothetical protein
MSTAAHCPWCHMLGNPGQPCRDCGHQVGVARASCDCRRCRERRAAASQASPAPTDGDRAWKVSGGKDAP